MTFSKVAAVAFMLTVCYFAYVSCENKRLEKAKDLIEKFDSYPRDSKKKLWTRKSHVCFKDSFRKSDEHRNKTWPTEKCRGTKYEVVCKTTVLGYERSRVYKCCPGYRNTDGRVCKKTKEKA